MNAGYVDTNFNCITRYFLAKDRKARLPETKKISKANRFFFIGLVLRRYLNASDARGWGRRSRKIQILPELQCKVITGIRAARFQIRKSPGFFYNITLPISKPIEDISLICNHVP
jgi:hypothetical protein